MSLKIFADTAPLEQDIIHEELTTAPSTFISQSSSEPEDSCTEVYANLDTVFDRVIGIGWRCCTKSNINKYFNPEAEYTATKKGHADLFDWMLIHDYDLFAQSLRNKLDNFFRISDFTIPEYRASHVILNQINHMEWNHLFDRMFSSDSKKSTKLTKEELDIAFPAIEEKINHLRDKFIKSKENKTLYILFHDTPECLMLFPDQRNTTISCSTISNLRDSLKELRDNDMNFCILFITDKPTFNSFENIIVREASTIEYPDGSNPERWKQILDEFRFTPDIWE